MKRTAALLCLVLLASCHRGANTSAPDAVRGERPFPLEQGHGDAERWRMQQIAGRWTSADAAVGHGRLVVDLSRDGRYTLDVRTPNPTSGIDTISSESTGDLEWKGAGYLSGSGSPPGRIVPGLRAWTASFPNRTHMLVHDADGRRTYRLQHRDS